jgi:hypothetical protein
LVYWVHIELVYGRWLNPLKTNLTVVETLLAAFAVILAMLVLSLLKTNRHRLLPLLAGWGWNFGAKPQGAPGD